MADVPLSHLSRSQLVHLLLRIVDLLSQPVMPAQSAPPVGGLPSGSGVELYDARLDPWNAPDDCQAAPSAPRDQRMPEGAVGCHFVQGQLNPAASAFYLVVSGPPACNPQSGCLDTPPGLVWIALDQCLVLSEVTTMGYPNLACPLRMPYLGVARGCTCVAIHVECVALPLNGGESAAVGSVTAISPFSNRVRLLCMLFLDVWVETRMSFALAANAGPKAQ